LPRSRRSKRLWLAANAAPWTFAGIVQTGIPFMSKQVWISTKIAMPENDTRVLVEYDGSIVIAWFYSDHFVFTNGEDMSTEYVKFWMDLPPLPTL
jgi:hypothetical protein